MYKFLKLLSDHKNNMFENTEYISKVIELFFEYKNQLTDDLYYSSDLDFMKKIVELINSLYPHFFVITKEDEFIGFVYLYDWKGDDKKPYSCYITTAFERKFWGEDVFACGDMFIKDLFEQTGLYKLKAEIFSNNKLARRQLFHQGFEFDTFLPNETLKNAKPIDMLVFSKKNPCIDNPIVDKQDG